MILTACNGNSNAIGFQTSGSEIVASPMLIDAGILTAAGEMTSDSLQIDNVGEADAEISKIEFIDKMGSGAWSISDDGSQILDNETSLLLDVTFAPDTPGHHVAELVIKVKNTTGCAEYIVLLRGFGAWDCAADDLDCDGFTETEGDCDDLDVWQSVGIDEHCDGLDNDCNKETDPRCDDRECGHP